MSPYTEHAASRLPNPTPLAVQAQDQQVVTTRSPKIITECLLTWSMYVHAIYSCFGIRGVVSNRKHEYEFITTITIKFDESFWFQLSSSDLLMLNTLVFFTYLDVRARLNISVLRLHSDRRTILIGRGPHLAMIPSPREVSIRLNITFTSMNHFKQLFQYEWFVNRIETQYRKCRKIWTWFPSSEMRKRMVQVWELRDLKPVPLQKAAQIAWL